MIQNVYLFFSGTYLHIVGWSPALAILFLPCPKVTSPSPFDPEVVNLFFTLQSPSPPECQVLSDRIMLGPGCLRCLLKSRSHLKVSEDDHSPQFSPTFSLDHDMPDSLFGFLNALCVCFHLALLTFCLGSGSSCSFRSPLNQPADRPDEIRKPTARISRGSRSRATTLLPRDDLIPIFCVIGRSNAHTAISTARRITDPDPLRAPRSICRRGSILRKPLRYICPTSMGSQPPLQPASLCHSV